MSGNRSTVTPRGGGLPGAFAAEWTKLWGVRSTWLCVGAALAIGTAVITLMTFSLHSSGQARTTVNASTGLGVLSAQFAAVALASLAITGEYATGAVRTTLTAVPRRGAVLAAKAGAVTVTALVTGVLLGLAGWAVSALFYGPHLVVHFVDLVHGTVGTGLYLALLSLFVLGLGAVLRSTAGTVTTTIGLLVGVPLAAQVLGEKAFVWFAEHSPAGALEPLVSGRELPYGAGTATVVLLVWAAAALAAGYALLRLRDA
ncbi:ABC transporter permease [Marinactinospora endophytica]